MAGFAQTQDWFIVANPSAPGDCWVAASDVDVSPETDLSDLTIFAAPPLASVSPTPGPVVPPATPSGLAAETSVCNGGYQVTISWDDNSSNEQGFRVYRKGPLQGDQFQLIHTTGPNADGSAGYVDNPPGSGEYTYYVVAFNAAGTSPQSNSDDDDGCLI